MDEELVARAQTGDVEAFSSLVGTRLPGIYRVASLIVGDADAAADAVQDALLTGWRDLPTLRYATAFDPWLRRLLVRSCRRASARRRRTRVVEIPMPAGFAPSTPDAQGALALRDQLERGFARLSPDHRAVVVLRHYVGLSLAETADAAEVPIGTVQSRLNRGLQALRAALDADERTPVTIGEAAR